MPARVFKHGVPPQRIRTFLVLFAVALAAPLLGLAIYGLNRMASLEQAQIERRVVQVAEDLAHDIDRELDRATTILDTLAGSAATQHGQVAPLRDELSDAELRVVRYLPSNLTANEIASALVVSANTVRTHMRHIYSKLDAHTRSEAVARARELGLVAPSAVRR